MATAAVRGMYAAIRRSDPDRPDADLLRQFAAARDEGAFTELVRRHGPLVLGVCRRVIGDRHQADDAFQAVFVVLANKAGRLGADRPLGPWLYGVAFRVALRARAMIGRRRIRETLAAVLPEVAVPPATEDASAVIDEEIDRLSAVCREALVLCELQGVSRKDAAKRLGIAEGTLSSRLAAAKKALAERLRERGVALGVGVTLPAVSSHLLAATVAISTGRVELSPHLLNLIHGATHMGLLGKLKAMAVGVLVVLLSVGGFGLIPSAESIAAPVPKDQPDEGLIWTHNTKTGVLTAYTPDGEKAKELTLKDGSGFLGFTPDGTQILFAGRNGQATNTIVARNLTLHLRGLTTDEKGTDTGLTIREHDQFVFSPDGKQIVRQRRDDLRQAKPMFGYFHVLFDVATKRETPIDLPTDHQIMQWSADGKTWRVMHHNNGVDPKLPAWRWLTTPASGQPDLKPICDAGSFNWLESDADGNTFFGAGEEHPAAVRGVQCLFRVTDGKPEVLTKFDRVAFANIRRSPDGRRVVCAKNEYDTKTWDWGDTAFVLFDSDGKNERKLVTFENDQQSTRLIGWFPAKSDARRKNAPVPKAEKEGTLLLWFDDGFHRIKPDGTKLDSPPQVVPNGGEVWYGGSLAPDGECVAWKTKTGFDRDTSAPQFKLGVRPLAGGATKDVAPSVMPLTLCWGGGSRLYFSGHERDESDKPKGSVKHWVYDRERDKLAEWPLPEKHHLEAVSGDGKTAVTTEIVSDDTTYHQQVCRVSVADGKATKLLEPDQFIYHARMSPDGTKLLGTVVGYKEIIPWKVKGTFVFKDEVSRKHVLIDLASGKQTDLKLTADGATLWDWSWSVEGKRIAVVWSPPEAKAAPGAPPNKRDDRLPTREYVVTVADPAGRKSIDVYKATSSRLLGFDWR